MYRERDTYLSLSLSIYIYREREREICISLSIHISLSLSLYIYIYAYTYEVQRSWACVRQVGKDKAAQQHTQSLKCYYVATEAQKPSIGAAKHSSSPMSTTPWYYMQFCSCSTHIPDSLRSVTVLWAKLPPSQWCAPLNLRIIFRPTLWMHDAL